MKGRKSDKEGYLVYELGYLILPSIPEDKLEDIVAKIRKVINKESGTEIEAETPFKHPLAYPMLKTVGASRYVTNDAYIGWIKFELEPSNIQTLRDELKKIEEILRFLLIKAPRETSFTFAKAKALLMKKEEGEETIQSSPIEEPVLE